mmetsp:Transcript_56697/g.101074  ORF Transcript_56697/g.101074 Transcript_56697/m.101074 type:complete len:91 (-) Transcript_56697:1428-1700(-)
MDNPDAEPTATLEAPTPRLCETQQMGGMAMVGTNSILRKQGEGQLRHRGMGGRMGAQRQTKGGGGEKGPTVGMYPLIGQGGVSLTANAHV